MVGVGDGPALGVNVGVGDGPLVGVGVTVGDGVMDGVTLGVGEGMRVGVGDGFTHPAKATTVCEYRLVTPAIVASYSRYNVTGSEPKT